MNAGRKVGLVCDDHRFRQYPVPPYKSPQGDEKCLFLGWMEVMLGQTLNRRVRRAALRMKGRGDSYVVQDLNT